MANRLLNKRIVIIGGTTGMGLSTALACVAEGAQVVVVGRNEEHAGKAGGQLGEAGWAIAADATAEDTATKAIQACKDRFGGFDALYHVAGSSGRKRGDGPLDQLTLDGWRFTLQVNLEALMLSNRAAVQAFLQQQQPGAVVNMSSILAFSPSPKHFVTHAYAAAKSAVIGFSQSVAAYYAAQNIRVNVIAPSLIETPMSQRAATDEAIQRFIKTKQPLGGGRMGVPQDVDGAAVFLLSDEARFITGQVIAVDGGWSLSEGQY